MKFLNFFDKILYHLSQPKLNIPKTILFNFRVLPFKQAIKFPVFFYGKVDFYWLKGKVFFLDTKIKRGIIEFGKNNEFNNGVKKSSFILLGENSKLIFQGPCSFGTGFVLRLADNAELRLGSDTFFGGSVKVICTKKITIGKFTRCAFESQFIDTNYHFTINTKSNIINNRVDEIVIGDYNWIGNRNSIMKGAKTKNDTIIASNSILNKDFTIRKEEFQFLGGLPANLISTSVRRIWSYEKEIELINYFNTENNDVYNYDSTFNYKDIKC